MQIDWFTFFAQIVNFLILVLLLRRFLYGPITDAMDAREAKIAERFREAERREADAQQEMARFRAQRETLDQQRESLLAEAESAADARRHDMIGEARDEVESMLSRWYDEVEHEREILLHDVRQQLGTLVVKLSDRVLSDIADGSLEAKSVSRFVAQLGALPAPERHALVASGGRFDQDVIVCSATELAYEQRQAIIEALGRLLDEEAHANGDQPRPAYPDEIGVQFEEDPALLCGVELRVRDRRVGWSMRDYLNAFEDELEASLTLEAEPA
jgi:F-type H+-transporting ATPase subunit b